MPRAIQIPPLHLPLMQRLLVGLFGMRKGGGKYLFPATD